MNNTRLYLKDINKIKMLDKDVQAILAKEAQAGNIDSKNKLAKANLRFVVTIAKKYQNQGLELDDLINEGNIGLLTAIDKFDPDKGYNFISYAVWWIRQSISKAINDKSRAVRLPINRSNELFQIQKSMKNLRKELSREPSIQEISNDTHLEEETINHLLSISKDLISLDYTINQDDNNSTLSDLIEDKKLNTEKTIIKNSMSEEINKILLNLNEREKDIIEKRFGLNGYKAMSLSQIGKSYNISKERIRQIEKRAISKLQDLKESESLRAFYVA